MRQKTMTNGEVASLHQILAILMKQSNIPLKFTISKNIKMLEKVVTPYDTKREELFRNAVKIDDKGNPCLKEEFKDQEGKPFIPYTSYEFNSPEAYQEMLKEMDVLIKVTNEVEFYTEKASRKIKVSIEKEGKVVYAECSIEDILEDPNNSVSSGIVMTLTEYMLD